MIAPGYDGPSCGDSRARQDINNFSQALELYKLQHYRYPTTQQGLEALLNPPTAPPVPTKWQGPYIASLNNDTWGTPFQYRLQVDGYKIVSLGADRKPGGRDCDSDLTSDPEPDPIKESMIKNKIDYRLETNNEIQSNTNRLLQAGCTLEHQSASVLNCVRQSKRSPLICEGRYMSVFNAMNGSNDQQDHLFEWNRQTDELSVTGLQGFLIMPEECVNGMDGELRWKNNRQQR